MFHVLMLLAAINVVVHLRRDRVSLKTLSLDRKLELVAGDVDFMESHLLGNSMVLVEVLARNPEARALVAQVLGHN